MFWRWLCPTADLPSLLFVLSLVLKFSPGRNRGFGIRSDFVDDPVEQRARNAFIRVANEQKDDYREATELKDAKSPLSCIRRLHCITCVFAVGEPDRVRCPN